MSRAAQASVTDGSTNEMTKALAGVYIRRISKGIFGIGPESFFEINVEPTYMNAPLKRTSGGVKEGPTSKGDGPTSNGVQ